MPDPITATAATPAEATPAAVTPAAATPITAQPATADFSKFIGPDGKFGEGWKDALLPEDMRGQKVYDKTPDVKSVLRQMGYLDKLVGAKGVIVPGEKATEVELAEFRKAIGVPETPDGYKYETPKDISVEDLSTEFLKGTMERFHKAGATPAVVNEALNIYSDHLREVEKQVDAMEAQAVAAADEALKTNWGASYEKNMHLANRFMVEATAGWPAEKRAALLGTEENGFSEGINSPEFASIRPLLWEVLANGGSKFMEHRIITDADVPAGKSSSEIAAEIATLEATPGFMRPDDKGSMMKDDGRMDLYKSLAQKRNELYRMMEAGKQH
jgi:hypothetical protein